MSLADLLPMPPWEGPPLPRFLGITWPWLQGGHSLTRYVTDVELEKVPSYQPAKVNTVQQQAPLASYQNEESWEIEWSDEGLPIKIVVHRKAEQR